MSTDKGKQEHKKRAGLEDWLSKNTFTLLVALGIGAALFALVVFSLYFLVFRADPVNAEAATMGQVGDFFGGILNPAFSFLSMLALLAALVIQGKELKLSRKELRLSRREMKKSAEALSAQNSAIEHQRFEQTFFAWLGTYRSMLENLEDVVVRYGANGPSSTTLRGSRVLAYWMNTTSSSIESRTKNAIPEAAWEEAKAAGSETRAGLIAHVAAHGWGSRISEISLEEWNSTYRDNESQLGGLFRVLYRLLLWIDSHDQRTLTTAQKWLYVSIIRAQLSEVELTHLFLNGYSLQGRKLKRLMERYALFDNLTLNNRPECLIMIEYPHDGTEYAITAFDSSLARREMGLPETAEETLALAAKGPHQGEPEGDTKTGDQAQTA